MFVMFIQQILFGEWMSAVPTAVFGIVVIIHLVTK